VLKREPLGIARAGYFGPDVLTGT